MIQEIFEHNAILSAHLAKKILEKEGIDSICKTPVDLSVIIHKKRYVKHTLIGNMLTHLAELGYLEKQSEIYVLVEEWQRSLPSFNNSMAVLREVGIHQLYYFQEYLSKFFIDIVRNDIQKVDLTRLIYYIDAIDGSKGLHTIRSAGISQLNLNGSPTNILDINFGVGYSAIQLATIFPRSKIFSLHLIPTLGEAYDYTIYRNHKRNLCSSKYTSEIFAKLMKEKIDLICLINPFGIDTPEFDKVLRLVSQVVKNETQILLFTPLTGKLKSTLVAEWLAVCIEPVDSYPNFDFLKVALSNHKFAIERTKNNSSFIIAKYNSEY